MLSVAWCVQAHTTTTRMASTTAGAMDEVDETQEITDLLCVEAPDGGMDNEARAMAVRSVLLEGGFEANVITMAVAAKSNVPGREELTLPATAVNFDDEHTDDIVKMLLGSSELGEKLMHGQGRIEKGAVMVAGAAAVWAIEKVGRMIVTAAARKGGSGTRVAAGEGAGRRQGHRWDGSGSF